MSWISIKDKLPNNGHKVIVYIGKKGITLKQQTAVFERWVVYIDGVETSSGYNFSYVFDSLQDHITHWQPILKKPKGE